MSVGYGDESRDIIVCGIPRSGTSLFCKLLHSVENCVVLNEPPGIGPLLMKPFYPTGLVEFYQSTRQKVNLGNAIKNKIKDGSLVEDTFSHNELSEYRPQVSVKNFLLGTKTTLPYLARLRELRAVFPHAKIVVMVRNPFDTISSWARSFEHLREANTFHSVVGSLNDPLLCDAARKKLEKVEKTVDLGVKRALWWKHLAEEIFENRHGISIVHYEHLVERPGEVIGKFLSYYDLPLSNLDLKKSTRTSKGANDPESFTAIKDHCLSIYEKLGQIDG